MASTITALFVVALALVLTINTGSTLASSWGVELEISTISAAPAVLPGAPAFAPEQSLSPDIMPVLPSPAGGSGVAPAGSIPTIPSNPSPPNPDDVVAPGPTSAAGAPSTDPFNAEAASNSATKCHGVECVGSLMLILGLVQAFLI